MIRSSDPRDEPTRDDRMTLFDVKPGRGPDELVLVTGTGRCLLLRGDGATSEEATAMARTALTVLRGAVDAARWRIRP